MEGELVQPSTSTTRSLTDLNIDSLSHCTNYLSPTDVANLALTCKPLRYAVYSDAVWRRLYVKRWPYQCIASGAEGFRELFIDRLTAVNRLKFLDPGGKSWHDYPVPYSHILLTEKEAYTAQGSILEKVRIDSAEISLCYSGTPMSHNARITCMRLLPTSDVPVFRAAVQNKENVVVTSSSDRTIRIWWKGRSYHCFKGHKGPVTILADELLGNCGSKVLASGGEDCTVRIWSLHRKNQSPVTTFHGHEKPISLLSVARHKSSLLVSMSADARVRVWDISLNSSGSSSCVGMVGFSGTPCGLKCHDAICYAAVGSSVVAVDIRTMQKVSTAATLPSKIVSFEMLPSNWLICTGGENEALLWDIRKAQSEPGPIRELDHIGKVTKIHMDPFKIVTGGPSDRNVKVWETGTGVLASQLHCYSPETYRDDDAITEGLCNMAVDGCRIVTTSIASPDLLYFRDFSNGSVPVSSSSFWDEDSGSKFWKSQGDEDSGSKSWKSQSDSDDDLLVR